MIEHSTEAIDYCTGNPDLFHLADDLESALTRNALEVYPKAAIGSLEPRSLGLRTLLRACGLFHGAMLMADRGMIAESRTLVRSVTECTFVLVALTIEPQKMVEVLEDDAAASRKLRAKFLRDRGLAVEYGTDVEAVINAAGKAQTMSPKLVAGMGPLLNWYLQYQVLSDDAAHTSLRSLRRHMTELPNNQAFYRFETGTQAEVEGTVYGLISTGIALGAAAVEIFEHVAGVADIDPLSNRFSKLPIPESW